MPGSPAGGADRVLYVLATLAETSRPLSLAELAERTRMPAATLRRLAGLLERWGFMVERDGSYVPGPLCLRLAWGFDQDSYLVQEALPGMSALAAETGEWVALMAWVRRQAVCLEVVPGGRPLPHPMARGRVMPLGSGASAKALLAFMPEGHRQALLEEMACTRRPDEFASLADELTAIRLTGYAVSNGEVDMGVWGVSAPIWQPSHQAVAVVTLMAPSTRAAEAVDGLIAATVAAAQRISERLQGR